MTGAAVRAYELAVTAFKSQPRGSASTRLSLPEYQPLDCLALWVDFTPLVVGLPDDGSAACDQQRAAALDAALLALHAQYGCLLWAPPSLPRQQYHLLQAVHFQLHDGDAAQLALAAALQAQSLTVELAGGRTVRLPVRAVAAELPPSHVRVLVSGLPASAARPGITDVLLRAAGYSQDQGVVVVHERSGFQVRPSGERSPWPAADKVVSVVCTPPGDLSLQRLPAVVSGWGLELRISVDSGVDTSPAFQLRRRVPVPLAALPAPSLAGCSPVLQSVAAGNGLTAAALAAAPPLVADIVQQCAQPHGSRAGLGSLPSRPAVSQHTTTIPTPSCPPPPHPSPAASPAQPSPSTEAPMSDIPELPDHPVFGTAVEWLQDDAGLSHSEAQDLVLQAHQLNPSCFFSYFR